MTEPSSPSWPVFSNSTLEKSAFVKELVRAIEAYHPQARNLFLFGKVQLRGKSCCFDLTHYAVLKHLRAQPSFSWLAPSALQYVQPNNAAGTAPLIAAAAVPAAIAADDVEKFTINDSAIFDVDSQICTPCLACIKDEPTRDAYDVQCHHSARELVRIYSSANLEPCRSPTRKSLKNSCAVSMILVWAMPTLRP